ncbi:MAG: hypothetical protein K2Q26_00680 [Bdellovibrionales bacterium]|nr:hypothetical protein [Bdellovibrionales bacterium]
MTSFKNTLFILLQIGTLIFLISCKKEEETQPEPTPSYNPVGTWEFNRIVCNGSQLTLNNFSEKFFISPSKFKSLSTGSGCTVEQRDSNWRVDANNLRVGDGSYACTRSPCEFNYSVATTGGPVAIDTIFCPSELGSPPTLSSDLRSATLLSDTELSQSMETTSGSATCTAYYRKTSSAYDVPSPTNETTWLKFEGGANEYITIGRDRNYTSSSGTYTSNVGMNNDVTINFTHITSSVTFQLIFKAPSNAVLSPGTYLNATRYPFQAISEPGMAITSFGRSCNTVNGQFEVLEVTYKMNGQIESLAVDFQQYCSTNPALLSGSIRINSSVP